jgi:3-oxoacyl-[acyl-carrier-protein] synthase I
VAAGVVQILGIGACTPVGRSVWASAAAARAGVSGFTEHPFMLDGVGEPMRVARALWLDIGIQGPERYWALLAPAIEEVIGRVKNRDALKPASLCLAIALPPHRPGRPADLASWLHALVHEHFRGLVARIAVYEFGHAAGYSALDDALRGMASSPAAPWIVAGVDSYLAPETLEWIEASDQFHGAGPLNNAWGFIPGEAASAVLIGTSASGQRLGLESLGDVISVGLGREQKLIKTDSVCTGEGLTAAFRSTLEILAPGEQIHNVFCDLNGETYRADEYGFTALRTKDHFRAATEFVAPADVWGDIGAAGAPLHIAMAMICHRKRYSRGPTSLTWASSESGERGAAVVRATNHWGT